ncbi:hypothetical protein CAY59_28225 (plasmid) [Vibrio campbellii]|nr:hypothetical protein CAY59_28225 [Vibrio campbellii]
MTCKVRCLKIKHRNQKLCASASRTKTERAIAHAHQHIDPLKHMGFFAPDEPVLSPELTEMLLRLLANI